MENTYKEHRFSRNPQEKEMVDKFKKMHSDDWDKDVIVFGHSPTSINPKDHLSEREKKIMLSTLQWLGSPVGQSYLADCGFKLR